jgi:hypothetical protein
MNRNSATLNSFAVMAIHCYGLTMTGTLANWMMAKAGVGISLPTNHLKQWRKPEKD